VRSAIYGTRHGAAIGRRIERRHPFSG
jgi:hypothetical protein